MVIMTASVVLVKEVLNHRHVRFILNLNVQLSHNLHQVRLAVQEVEAVASVAHTLVVVEVAHHALVVTDKI